MVVSKTCEERELSTYVVEDRSVVTTAAVGQMKIYIHHYSLFLQSFPGPPTCFFGYWTFVGYQLICNMRHGVSLGN